MTGETAYGKGEYLCYQIISRLDEKGVRVSRTKFLKLPCMADRFLADELGQESVLPRHWFKYGEIIDVNSLEGDYYKSGSSNLFPGREYTLSKDLDPDNFNISDSEREFIDEAVKWAVTTHGSKNYKQLRSVQYRTYAPREFIRSYGELRDILEHFREEDAPTQYILDQYDPALTIEEIVRDKLDSMVISYPKEDYSEMYRIFLRWDDTARLLLGDNESLSEINTLLDSFVETLSEQILFYKHNANIGNHRIETWRESHSGNEQVFLDSLNDRRESILVNRKISDELEKVTSEYSELVRENLTNN